MCSGELLETAFSLEVVPSGSRVERWCALLDGEPLDHRPVPRHLQERHEICVRLAVMSRNSEQAIAATEIKIALATA
jgi:hypothetical protein